MLGIKEVNLWHLPTCGWEYFNTEVKGSLGCPIGDGPCVLSGTS